MLARQNNPDVNSLNIGDELETHPESINTGADSGRTNVVGTKKPASEGKKSVESTEQTEKKK